MKIVDRASFLAMPAGTIYAKYEPHIFGDLTIKGDSINGIDFTYQDLIAWFETDTGSESRFETLETMIHGAESPPLDYEYEARDGLFDQDQLFAVFGRDDVERLISRIQLALIEGYAITPTSSNTPAPPQPDRPGSPRPD